MAKACMGLYDPLSIDSRQASMVFWIGLYHATPISICFLHVSYFHFLVMPKILGALQVTLSLLFLCLLAVTLCQSYAFVLMSLYSWCSVSSFVSTVKNTVVDDLWFVFRKYKESVTRFWWFNYISRKVGFGFLWLPLVLWWLVSMFTKWNESVFSNTSNDKLVQKDSFHFWLTVWLSWESACASHSVEWHLNPLNAKLNPICHLLTLLGAHHILHVSRIRVK